MKLFAATLLSVIAAGFALAPIYHVDEANDGIRDRYVIKLKDAVLDVDAVVDRFAGLPSFLLHHGRIHHRFYKAIKGFSATLTGPLLDIVRTLEAVDYVHQETIFRTQSVDSWGIDRLDQRDLPLDDTYMPTGDGSGVHVYVIDTGVNTGHEDLAGRVIAGFDAKSEDINDPQYGVDCNGHGSHCSGTVAGTKYGVAKGATIVGVRAIGCNGLGLLGDITSAIEYVTRDAIFPAVASMSLGGASNIFIDRAVQGMLDAGVVVSVAAGNSDVDACRFSPAGVPDAITVAASDSSDVRAYFSNWGSCVDVFAPGVSITSIGPDSESATFVASGTSMACPHVSGAAAVVLGNNPSFTRQHVTAAIVNGATPDKITDAKNSPNRLLYVP